MKEYYEGIKMIQKEGYFTGDRTGVGTQALPGYHYAIRMNQNDDGTIDGFPLLTLKKTYLRGAWLELLWKLAGHTNIIPLIKKNIHIWTEWPFKKWLEQTGQINSFKWFIDDEKSDYTDEWKKKIKEFEDGLIDGSINESFGELGHTYGYHMRNFGEVRVKDLNDFAITALLASKIDLESVVMPGIDQLAEVLHKIIHKPTDRRIIMSLWNAQDTQKTLLPPCPCFYQFFANQDGYLHMNVYQRSCDTFLGVPFNDSQDSLLLIILAAISGRKVCNFNHFFGDFHIYTNHKNQVAEMLSREPKKLPSIELDYHFDTKEAFERTKTVREAGVYLNEIITNLKWENIKLIGYDPHPTIKAPVAI